MAKRTQTSQSLIPWFGVVFGLLCLSVLIGFLLRGTDVELFHPKGQIAQQEFRLIIISAVVLLVVAVPSVLLFYFFAWKYRETNVSAVHDPEGHHSKYLV